MPPKSSKPTKKQLEEQLAALQAKLASQGITEEVKAPEQEEPLFKPVETPAPKKRGRPKKVQPQEVGVDQNNNAPAAAVDTSAVKPVRQRKPRATPAPRAVKKGIAINEINPEVLAADVQRSLAKVKHTAPDTAKSIDSGSNDSDSNPDSDGESVSDEEEEREKIRQRYFRLLEQNPNLENKTPPKFKQIAEECDKLPIEELRLRIKYAEHLQYEGLDSRIAEDILGACSLVIGKVLRCHDELQDRVQKDKYLNKVTGQMLHENVLHQIPVYMKAASLYGSHVIGALKDKRTKNYSGVTGVEVAQPQQQPEPAQLTLPPVDLVTTQAIAAETGYVPVSSDKVEQSDSWDPVLQKHI